MVTNDVKFQNQIIFDKIKNFGIRLPPYFPKHSKHNSKTDWHPEIIVAITLRKEARSLLSWVTKVLNSVHGQRPKCFVCSGLQYFQSIDMSGEVRQMYECGVFFFQLTCIPVSSFRKISETWVIMRSKTSLNLCNLRTDVYSGFNYRYGIAIKLFLSIDNAVMDFVTASQLISKAGR